MKRYGQLGVAVLSRGRERAADVAAAELTGSPAALAGALERLTEARDRPETDLREWEHSVAAMDILPPPEPGVSTEPFRTHPLVKTRVEHPGDDRIRRDGAVTDDSPATPKPHADIPNQCGAAEGPVTSRIE